MYHYKTRFSLDAGVGKKSLRGDFCSIGEDDDSVKSLMKKRMEFGIGIEIDETEKVLDSLIRAIPKKLTTYSLNNLSCYNYLIILYSSILGLLL